MHEVIMPKLGVTMESGAIERWHKKEGDRVEIGDILFEVMTDKVSMEVESNNSGILRKILKFEGEIVPVAEAIAYIGGKDEDIPQINIKNDEMVEKDIGKVENVLKTKENISNSYELINLEEQKEKKVRLSPLAKKMAENNKLDITKIKGSYKVI